MDVPGYCGIYKVSRSGSVLSCAKKAGKWKRLKHYVGYPKGKPTRSVSLVKNKAAKTFYVHRLVKLVFGIEPLPKGARLVPRGRGRYAVTKQGVVWSNSATKSNIPGEWKKVTPVKSRDGYLRIRFRFNAITEYHFLHRLVLETFVGTCPKGMECRHFPDPSPVNCCLGNLQWGTPLQNARDKKLCQRN